MSPQRRTTTSVSSAALGLLLLLPLAACGDDADPEPSGARPEVISPSQPSVAEGVGPSSARAINLTVTKGKVGGVGETVEVPLNTPVRITVIADVAEVLLVQGYGATAQLTVDEPVQLSFIADKAGDFTVSLTGSDQVLTRLRVA